MYKNPGSSFQNVWQRKTRISAKEFLLCSRAGSKGAVDPQHGTRVKKSYFWLHYSHYTNTHRPHYKLYWVWTIVICEHEYWRAHSLIICAHDAALVVLLWAVLAAVLPFWVHHCELGFEVTHLIKNNNIMLHHLQFVPKFSCQTAVPSRTGMMRHE